MTTTLSPTAPASVEPKPIEQGLAAVPADVVGAEQVPPDANFFDDLGADSMLTARFCAQVRERTDLPSVSIREVYQHPTVRDLPTASTPAAAPVAPVPPEPAPVPVRAGSALAPAGTPHVVRTPAAPDLPGLLLPRRRRPHLELRVDLHRRRRRGHPQPAPPPLLVVRTLVRGSPMALFAGSPSHSSPDMYVDFVHAAQRTFNAHSDFWSKGST
jgi:acyl carrier protein